jgi:hypothetical protein
MAPEFEDEGWARLQVRGNWKLQRHGEALYANIGPSFPAGPAQRRRRKIRQVVMYALKGVHVLRVQIPAGNIAPARSTGSGSGGNK